MKVESYRTRIVDLSGQPSPAPSPAGRISHFVTLELDAGGVTGIGYAGFVTAPTVKALKAMLDGLCELAIGMDALATDAITSKLLAAGGAGSPGGLVTRAVAAIDIALWDIKGKALGQPVWKLLGGSRSRVPCYASGHLWRTYDLDALAEWGPKLVEQGFRAMKFRMGDEASWEAEVERMRVMRESVGPQIDLMVDINQGWDVNRAIRVGRACEPYDLYWLEDPIHFEDYNGFARIANALDTPVAAGEYLYGIRPFAHLLERGSVDIAMVDLLRAGGITPWMKIAAAAEAFNIPVVTHLAPEILAHCAAAAPNGLIVEHMPWSFPLFTEEPVVENGEIVLSDRPGLGLDLAPA